MRSFSKDDLRLAYYFIRTCSGTPCDDPGARDSMIIEYKRAIRDFYKRQNAKDRRCIDDDPYGYYTMLIEAPEHVVTRPDAEEWFHECEEMQYIPSQYDCTGQHFTLWYKLVKRRGRWYCYHRVGVDI